MGMYTELVLKCEIDEHVPDDVEQILRYLFNRDTDAPDVLPDHPFFKCDRWQLIGSCSSFYHIPFALSKYDSVIDQEKGGYIFSRCDLRNYGDEIGLFIDWLNPYIDEEKGHCIGWQWYEEDREPTLLYKA